MDNKITKKRLSDFLAYEWIVIVALIAVAIFVWVLLFGFFEVKPKKGQQFMIAYDQGVRVSSECKAELANDVNLGVFSYDVLEVGFSEVGSDGESDILAIRYATEDLDVIVTNDDGEGMSRMKEIIDGYNVWAFEDMIIHGKAYLQKFVKNGTADQDLLKTENLDREKIGDYFAKRQKKDNRFRSAEQIEKGREQEVLRIEKLCVDLQTLSDLLENHHEIFVRYTKYQETAKLYPDKPAVQDKYQKQEEKSYAVDLTKLKGGKQVSNYFNRSGSTAGLVLMSFDFPEEQPDLRFESISFINHVVKTCSNIYS